jgi:ArsR family transcriptional regulator, arsenate/arsenite/antimonite-responsive transcriptional repressor
MGISKTEAFTAQQNNLANIAKALGHPARIAILEYLLRMDHCICGDIVAELPLAQATVSQHLKALKEANLIQGSISGNAICYCINPETIGQILSYFSAMGTCLQAKNNKCC